MITNQWTWVSIIVFLTSSNNNSCLSWCDAKLYNEHDKSVAIESKPARKNKTLWDTNSSVFNAKNKSVINKLVYCFIRFIALSFSYFYLSCNYNNYSFGYL